MGSRQRRTRRARETALLRAYLLADVLRLMRRRLRVRKDQIAGRDAAFNAAFSARLRALEDRLSRGRRAVY